MIRSRFIRSVALTLSITLALSCSSDIAPTAPIMAPTVAQDGLISGLLGVVTNLLGSVLKVIVGVVAPRDVHAVKWAPSHVNQVRSVSGYVGYSGGTLSIPGSDFTITFPRGALSTTTKITIISDGCIPLVIRSNSTKPVEIPVIPPLRSYSFSIDSIASMT